MIFVEMTDDQEWLEIKFKPVKYHLDRMKSIAGAKFYPDEKLWTLPIECFDDLEETFKGELIWVTPRYMITGENPPPPPNFWAKVGNAPVPGLKMPLYAFQVFGANFLAYVARMHGFGVLGDLMGLGKTPQAIGGAEIMRAAGEVKKTLIVCLSPLKMQWQRDGIDKFTDATSVVIKGTPTQRQKLYKDAQNADYVITSYELVLKDILVLEALQKSGKLQFDLIIADEAHKLKNREGKTNNAFAKLKAPFRFFLTGTPVMNRPDELYGLLQAANFAETLFGKFSKFAKKFLNYQYNGRFQDLVGYRNLDELRETFGQYLLRRTDKEVEMDLPDMVEVNDYVEMTPFQKKMDEVLQGAGERANNNLLRLQKMGASEEELRAAKGAAQGTMNLRIGLFDAPELFTVSNSEKIRDQYGEMVLDAKGGMVSPKLERLLDIVEELVSSGEKVVIFTQFKRMVKIIMREIRARQMDTKISTYYGGMDEDMRDAKIMKFKNNKDFKVFIATEAGSTGLNLQFARYLINYDLPWNPAIWEQRKGRIRRLGSAFSKVKIINLMVRGSIDETMYETLEKKQNVFNALVENDARQSKRLSKLSSKGGEQT